MLQKAVELEVTEFRERDHSRRPDDRLLRGYRRGCEDQQVPTGFEFGCSKA